MVISFANIFSQSANYIFIVLMVSFSMQKPLSLIRVQLFIFAFVSFAWGDRSKKISLWFMTDYFAYVFSSWNFMFSGLTFWYLIHFEFIFVYSIIKCSNFILFTCGCSVFQLHLMKTLSFLHCIFICFFS